MVSIMLAVWIGAAIGNVIALGLVSKKWGKAFEFCFFEGLILIVVYIWMTYFPPPL